MGGIPVTITDKGVPVSLQGDIPASSIPFGSPGDPAGPLGPDGRIPSSQLPPLEHDIARAATEAEMLALAVTTPAICIRTDFTPPHVFYLVADPPTTVGNWEDTGEFGASTANPTATVGLTAKNGTADTIMRSDAAPALDQSIAPTWTGAHTFSQTMTTAAITASGLVQSSGGVAGNTTVTAGIGSNSVQMTGAPNGSDPKIQALGVTDANVSIEMSAKGSGLLKMASPVSMSSTLTVTGSTVINNDLNVKGNLGSSANSGLPSPTNSGVNIAGAPNWGMVQFYDSARSANNRSMDILFIGDGLHMRFVNDARNAFLDFLSVQGGQATGVTGIASTSGSGAWTHTGAFSVSGAATLTAGVTSYLGVATQGAGVAPIYADHNLAAQGANVSATTLFAVPANKGGMYRVSAYAVVTRAATTSSTLPNVGITWTDNDSSVALSAPTVTPSNPANALGAFGNGDVVIYAKGGTNIQFQTSNYASSGATSMQYAVHLKLQYLG